MLVAVLERLVAEVGSEEMLLCDVSIILWALVVMSCELDFGAPDLCDVFRVSIAVTLTVTIAVVSSLRRDGFMNAS